MIDIENLRKSFGEVEVLKGINLTIKEKEVVVIIGPSGSGKSTLLRCMNYLEEPTSGKVSVDGIVLDGEANINKVREEVGMVFQRFNLFPHMTVLQNIMLAPIKVRHISKQEAEDTARKLLARVGLADKADSYPNQLSGGQQQRVAFARAIVIEPACILFDEPLSALDALLREEMRSELRTLITKLGITGVFVTHDQIEAMSMSDAIAVCHAGKIEQYDTPEKIYSHPATEFVARFVGSSNWLDQNHLFRPEQAQTVPTEQAEKYDADVTAVQFLGSSYQLQLNHNGQDWTYISPRRVSVGEKISLYLPRSAIVAV